jgi:heavy metal efflux system protein
MRPPPGARGNPQALGRLLIDAPDGSRVPVSLVADVKVTNGPFFIYRETGQRYIAVKFGVRGRDLGGAVAAAQELVNHDVHLDRGYTIRWDGQFNEMKVAQQKLMVIIPVALTAIFVLLCLAFRGIKDATLVLINVPYAAIGGIVALYFAGEDLSISAGIGFLSLFGIAIQNLVILITSIRELAGEPERTLHDAVIEGASRRFRAVIDDRAIGRAWPCAGGILPRHRLAGAAAVGTRHLRGHAVDDAPDASHPPRGVCPSERAP